jgi:UPF0755 protein
MLPTKLAAAATALAVFVVLIAAYLVARTPNDVLGGELIAPVPASTPGAEVDYTLPKGRSAADVGRDLEKLGVIRSATQFDLLVSLMGVQDKLSAGDYTLRKSSATVSVVNELTVKDAVPVLRVTFPEGIRVEEMAVLAEKAGFGSQQQFLDAVKAAQPPPEIAGDVPAEGAVPGYRLLGFLFPDTYILPVGSTPAQLVDLMLKTFVKRFTPELRAAAQTHGVTVYQAVTLASIVEREAAIESERPLIAGVFYNRIAQNDLLGADPTVQFAVALDAASVAKYGWWKKELTADDLANKSKYNTRLFAGLPPGPITNPGLASLQAVANPTATKYYYFVADAKKADGSHVFAETAAQHEQNKRQYGAP